MTCWLSSEQARPFAHLTTASLAVALDGLVVPTAQLPMSTDALLAAGQTFAGLPAALAVVKLTTHAAVEVISLAVAEPFRQWGWPGSCCCGCMLRSNSWGAVRCP